MQRPVINNRENLSVVASAENIQKATIRLYMIRRPIVPKNPNSYARVVNIKSVCFSGKKLS